MRVLAIRAKNLASLPRFEVDLTKGALAKTRIFAITGPTGAGKSTLLDALCLALYDRAPRLGGPRDVPVGELEVTASDPRSLMRRGAIDASSEVEFLARDQRRYRATWEVWRARKRPDGKIQSQKMRLFCVDTSKDLTGGTKTETLAIIEQLIGLSYDEFRRAVLLAQGDFATFLRAKMDERAELLEKMTGTEIYAEISRAAFQRAKLEEETLAALEARLGSFSVLPDDERRVLEQSIQRLGASRTAALALAEDGRKALRREEAIARFLEEIDDKTRALTEAEAAFDATIMLRGELDRTRAAERMRGAFESASRAESALDETAARSEASVGARLSAEEKKRDAGGRVERLRIELDAKKDESLRIEPEIERAKKLDVQLEDARVREAAGAREEKARREAHREADRAREAALSAIEAREKERKETATWLLDQRALEPLAAQWPRWKETLDRHRVLVEANAKRAKEKAKADRSLKDALAAETRAKEALEGTNEAIAALASKTAAIRSALDAHRKAHAAHAVREAVERIARELASLEAMKLVGREARRLARETVEETEREEAEKKAALAARTQALELEKTAGDLDAKAAVLRAEKTLVEAKVELAARRGELLREGEPCPLCGALDHPAASDRAKLKGGRDAIEALTEELERTEDALSKARDQAKSAHESASSHTHASTRAKERIEKLRPEIARKDGEWKKKLEALEMIWLDSPVLARRGVARAARSIVSSPNAKNADATVSRAIEAFVADQSELKAWLAEDESLAKKLEEARVAEDRAEEEKRSVVKLVDRVRGRVEEERRRLAEIEAARARAEALAEETERALAAVFDEAARRSFVHDPSAFIEARAKDVEAYERARTVLVEVDEALKKVAADRSRLDAELRLRAEEHERTRGEHAAAKTRLDGLAQERALLLGGRDVEEVAGSIREAIDRARIELESATTDERALGETLAACDARAKAAAVANRDAALELERANERLDGALAASTLSGAQQPATPRALEAQADEMRSARELLARLLAHDAAWIADAESQIARAHDAVTRLRSTLEDREKQLFAVAGGETIDRPSSTARVEVAKTKTELAEARLIEAIEAEARAKNQLTIDDETRTQVAHLRPEIDRQRARTERWAELSLLIGSADGKKLRSFAQGLTLDALLAQANLHLEQLRPRYRLERVPGFDMELQVIDGDMGDEVRAVATLSGGETFLVSLALALGLSSLSAKNVSIRSLFIDEGFGSLDKEALEAALATLDQLQAGGRTIGLISHMPDVAERIGYQIHVRPTGPGRSEVVVLA